MQVFSASGQWLKEVPAQHAQRLLDAGAIARRGTKVIRAIELASPPNPRETRGLSGNPQRYTQIEAIRHNREVCGHVLTLKHIDDRDQELFMLAVAECGGVTKQQRSRR